MGPPDTNRKASRVFVLLGKIEEFFEGFPRPGKDLPGVEAIPLPEKKLSAIAGVLALPLSQAARILLISSLLQSRGDELNCRFNELASISGLSERTAYRALKEIKESGLFEIKAIPGTGVTISSGWLWNEPGERALRILGDHRGIQGQSISMESPKE
jgi:DNA-binding transcriptional ArsR family regulator